MKKIWDKITNWERWPFVVIYAPLGFAWAYYACKAKAFWFFSNVNPTLEFSGFEGEPKKEMYEQLPVNLYPKTLFIKAGTDFQRVQAAIINAGIEYPFVTKPDVGMQGILFRKISKEKDLFDYHQNVPVDYLVQEFVDLPLEFSVFHIKYPGQTKGKVTGFILKEYMYVEGDGVSTLLQLIEQHPKAQDRTLEMTKKHEANLAKVLEKGEKYTLSIAGNHNRGARFINLHREIDAKLCNVFDAISNKVGPFYFGRYDLKCTSMEDLKAGKSISILEFNGAGAEPNHIYDCGMSYVEALKEIVRHWRDLYQIGQINEKNGIPYWNFKKGYRYLRKASRFFDTLRQYDLQF